MATVKTNGTTLNYRLEGPAEGPVVMLSHSLGSSLEMWPSQVPALVAAGYRVVLYDTRGHGRSAAPAGDYSMEMLAADAVGLMDYLNLEKVHFCGLSMGGMIGQTLGAAYGERLHSLVLSSTAAFAPTRDLWDERMQLVRTGGLAAVVDATIDRWFTDEGQARLPDEVAQVRRLIVDTPVDGFCGCSAAIRDMDLRAAIETIDLPTLILVGEHDQGTPVAAAQYIHDRIASSRMQVIADAAHFVQMQQAQIFNQALLDFLGRQVS